MACLECRYVPRSGEGGFAMRLKMKSIARHRIVKAVQRAAEKEDLELVFWEPGAPRWTLEPVARSLATLEKRILGATERVIGRRAYGKDRWSSFWPTWGTTTEFSGGWNVDVGDLVKERRWARAVDALLDGDVPLERNTAACAAFRASGRYAMALEVAVSDDDVRQCHNEAEARAEGDKCAAEEKWTDAARAYGRFKSASLSLLSATAWFRAGNFHRAAETFAEAAELHPDDPVPKVWTIRARCHTFLASGDDLNALARASTAVEDAITDLVHVLDGDDWTRNVLIDAHLAFYVAERARIERNRAAAWTRQNHLRRQRLYGTDYYLPGDKPPFYASPQPLEEEFDGHDDVARAYAILGLDAREIKKSEVKAAYRRKMLETHPDKSKDPDAETRFRRVQEAYAILTAS